MRDLTADLFVSLDGFAADAQGTQRWARGGPDVAGFMREVLAEPQVLVLGRATYERVAGFGASAPGRDPFADRMNAIPKIVFSQTLKEPLAWSHARLAIGTLAAEIPALKAQPGPPLRTIGSIRLVRGLVQLGLVDRIRLLVFPVVLGRDGREPVFAEHAPTSMDLVGSTVLDAHVLVLEYRPRAAA